MVDVLGEFEGKLDKLLDKGIKSLIIDVRDNGGGVVAEAVDIAELLLPKDKTVMIEVGKDGEENVTKTEMDARINSEMQVIILTNENTASASEILVGALKDNGVAKAVGTQTFGKGVMQEIVPVSTGGALKLTIQEFYTPNRTKINKQGIEPDEIIEEDKETEEDEQLQKAIELLK